MEADRGGDGKPVAIINITQRDRAYMRILAQIGEWRNDKDDYIPDKTMQPGFLMAFAMIERFILEDMKPPKPLKGGANDSTKDIETGGRGRGGASDEHSSTMPDMGRKE